MPPGHISDSLGHISRIVLYLQPGNRAPWSPPFSLGDNFSAKLVDSLEGTGNQGQICYGRSQFCGREQRFLVTGLWHDGSGQRNTKRSLRVSGQGSRE